MQSLELLLRKSAMHHTHLCPRQVLGVRIGLAGMNGLGLTDPWTAGLTHCLERFEGNSLAYHKATLQWHWVL